jgi:hypothetical protein
MTSSVEMSGRAGESRVSRDPHPFVAGVSSVAEVLAAIIAGLNGGCLELLLVLVVKDKHRRMVAARPDRAGANHAGGEDQVRPRHEFPPSVQPPSGNTIQSPNPERRVKDRATPWHHISAPASSGDRPQPFTHIAGFPVQTGF